MDGHKVSSAESVDVKFASHEAEHLEAAGKYVIHMVSCMDWLICTVLKGLKATNEWQDDGTGVLHQVAQHPIDQVYFYTRHHASLHPRKT